jgi:hypothetical protein
LIGIPVPGLLKKTDGNRHRGVLPENWVKKRLEKNLVLLLFEKKYMPILQLVVNIKLAQHLVPTAKRLQPSH